MLTCNRYDILAYTQYYNITYLLYTSNLYCSYVGRKLPSYAEQAPYTNGGLTGVAWAAA